MAHYPEVMERGSPQRGQIIVYRDHLSTSSTEDNDIIEDPDTFQHTAFYSASPSRTTPTINKPIKTKKTSCPDGFLVTRRDNSVKARPRPKSLAFDQEITENSLNDAWQINQANSANDSSLDISLREEDVEVEGNHHRIRKYRSVISLSSDNTSSVQTVLPQPKAMSKSVHQSPIKPGRTNPKMIDVSPQYFSSSQAKSRDQQIGASRVKQLLFRRMSRSSDSKSTEFTRQESVSKRSKSSSSPTTRSNMRFLRKKVNDDEENYLLNSPPHLEDDDKLDVSNHIFDNSNPIPSEPNRPMVYSSAEESD